MAVGEGVRAPRRRHPMAEFDDSWLVRKIPHGVYTIGINQLYLEETVLPQLFNYSAGSYPAYPEPFRQSLLEQYNLCLQSADNASGRREASNRYLITLNVALLALYGLQSVGSVNLYLLVPVALAGLIVSFLSLRIIRAYKNLNAAKFDVILKLEQYLPAAALGYEWELLKQPPKGKAYWPVSDLERHIYWVFGGLHVLLPLLVAVVLPLAGITDWPQLTT